MKKPRSIALATVTGVLAAALLLAAASAPATDTDVEPGAPDQVVLDQLVQLYGPVAFDHQMHTYIAGTCASCHHQHGQLDVSQCQGCHSFNEESLRRVASGGFMSCRHCHGDPDPSVPAMPGLKVAYHRQCFSCHLGTKGLGEGPAGCTAQCHTRRKP